MALEEIKLNGRTVTTLKELLRPGLKTVFVGLNPAPVSVKKKHYHQGRLGQRFWSRLREHKVVNELHHETEDDDAFEAGFGFADLVRRPTARATDLTHLEKSAGVADLADRLSKTGDRPAIVFIYKAAWDFAEPHLSQTGYRVFRMPGPYTKKRVSPR
jgi:TDG/mug DNA glycosylase family protein